MIYYKTCGVLIDTWTNESGSRFVRIYADGYCEQGGHSTSTYNNYFETLPTPFKNTSYNVVASMLRPSNYDGNLNVYNKTTTGFNFYTQHRDNMYIATGYVF